MMIHLLVPSFVAMMLLSAAAGAQSTCTSGSVNAAIDVYASEPFGARAWRKMSGVGDAGISASNDFVSSYATVEEWRNTVAEVLPANTNLQNPSYRCRLRYPLDVLKARIAAYGKNSDYVKQWMIGQEAVLVACAGEAPATMPIFTPPATWKSQDVSLFQHDRTYQQAAIAFYQEPTRAVQAFRVIAASDSPHKAAARYNVANLLANAKTLVEARAEANAILGDPTLSSVHDITRSLLGYIANLEDTAPAWAALIDQTIETLSKPSASVTGDKAAQEKLARALYDIDYIGVSAKQNDWWVTNTLPANPTLSKALADAARKHPMILWMMAGQSVHRPMTQAPWALMGPQWQAWSASYIDRAQALQAAALPDLPKVTLESLKATADDASRAGLWAQAQAAAAKASASCGEAPETASVALLSSQAIRVSAMAGRYDEIYANLPKLNLDGSISLRDVLLPKLMQHLLATGDAEEGRRLRDLVLTETFLGSFTSDDLWKRNTYATFLAWVAEDEPRWRAAVSLMTEKLSPAVLNWLPAAQLRELANDPMFSPQQKALLKRAAWTRNLARGIPQSKQTTADMLAANPDIAAALDAVKRAFPKLNEQQAFTLTILRNPRFGILVNSPDSLDALETPLPVFSQISDFDPNDRNWWCPLEPDRQLLALRRQYNDAADLTGVMQGYASQAKALLETDGLTKAEAARERLLRQHPMVKSINWKEAESLAKVPSAPKFLAQAAIRLARNAKPNDAAAAEALALAVRATRFGCRWHGSHEAYSKPAQELLKTRFAQTSWAARTPYWFGCMDTQTDTNLNKVTSCKPRTWPKQALPR